MLYLLAAIGLLAGMINVLAGGGSLLTLPILVLCGYTGPVANGTNRIAILVQNVTAVLAFRRGGYRGFRLGFQLALAALPGAVLGAWLGTRLEGPWFNRVLAGLMLVVLAFMIRGNRPESATAAASPPRKKTALGLMVLVGLYGGFIQAGVGFLLMFVLHRILRLDLVEVNMHKVLIVGIYTIPAIGVFAWQGNVVWQAGLALAVGNGVGGWLGSRLTLRGGEAVIRPVLVLAILGLAARLIYDSF